MNITTPRPAYAAIVRRPEAALPILITTGGNEIAIRAGAAIRIGDVPTAFDRHAPIDLGNLVAGADYAIGINAAGTPYAAQLGNENPIDAGFIGGFHFAPGGNAPARAGGDSVPAINPSSIWDAGFRPTAPDPRGMTLVETPAGDLSWLDIYLLGTEHATQGTSRFGATIADGRSLPSLDYYDAVNILASYGKRLPTYDEFRAGTFGVTEKSSAPRHPKITGLDAARTSRIGVMQATGNLSVWGTDGDPDDPRPALFGGSWINGGYAGSRYAILDIWDGYSCVSLGCRGASDHLGPA